MTLNAGFEGDVRYTIMLHFYHIDTTDKYNFKNKM